MNHRTWKMEICYSTPLTELRNEHNALYADWKQSSLEVEHLAKVNGDLCDKIAELKSRPVLTWEECEKEWMRLRGSMEDGVPIQNRKFLAWLQSRLPAPIRVPFSDHIVDANKMVLERASDEELGKLAYDTLYPTPSLLWSAETTCCKANWVRTAAAVRARVEAPLLAEIARLEAEIATERDKANRFDATAQGLSEIVDGQKRDKDSLLNLLVRVTYERDTLRAQLDAVTAERDAAQDDAAAIFDIASQDDADTPLEAVRKLKEYADTIEWREAHTESANNSLLEQLAALRQLTTATPTDAQVEALAKAMHAKTRFIGWNEMLDVGRESWRNSARAAYAHIGRVPVGWELDVHPDQLELYKWVTMPDGGYAYATQQAIDLCRSRIKPVYECKECAKKEEQYQDLISAGNDEADRINKAMEAIDAARAALEGE